VFTKRHQNEEVDELNWDSRSSSDGLLAGAARRASVRNWVSPAAPNSAADQPGAERAATLIESAQDEKTRRRA